MSRKKFKTYNPVLAIVISILGLILVFVVVMRVIGYSSVTEDRLVGAWQPVVRVPDEGTSWEITNMVEVFDTNHVYSRYGQSRSGTAIRRGTWKLRGHHLYFHITTTIKNLGNRTVSIPEPALVEYSLPVASVDKNHLLFRSMLSFGGMKYERVEVPSMDLTPAENTNGPVGY